jgi:hypothetical protein
MKYLVEMQIQTRQVWEVEALDPIMAEGTVWQVGEIVDQVDTIVSVSTTEKPRERKSEVSGEGR